MPDATGKDLFFAQSSGRYNQALIDGVYRGLIDAGIDFAVFMPDATMDGIEQLIVQRKEIEAYQCVREDEGIAMAIGAYMVGRKPVMLMEGSGIGMSGIILARSLVQRCPLLIIAGHCGTLGERYDYHATARMVMEPTFRGLNIPFHVMMDAKDAYMIVREGQRTVEGQKVPFGIFVPNHVLRG